MFAPAHGQNRLRARPCRSDSRTTFAPLRSTAKPALASRARCGVDGHPATSPTRGRGRVPATATSLPVALPGVPEAWAVGAVLQAGAVRPAGQRGLSSRWETVPVGDGAGGRRCRLHEAPGGADRRSVHSRARGRRTQGRRRRDSNPREGSKPSTRLAGGRTRPTMRRLQGWCASQRSRWRRRHARVSGAGAGHPTRASAGGRAPLPDRRADPAGSWRPRRTDRVPAASEP